MQRRARAHPGEGPPPAPAGRLGEARFHVAGVLGIVAAVAFASTGAYIARANGPVPAVAVVAVTSTPVASPARAVRAALPGIAAMSSRPVQFHRRLAPKRKPKSATTTTTTVPVTAPTTPRVVASIAGPISSYPTSSELCAEAVAQISWPSGWPVNCEGSRPGLLGLTNRYGTHLYMRSGLSESFYVMVAGHEAGHAWDFARLSPADIVTWCAARGCDAAHFFDGAVSGPGWVEAGGAEDWAEAWRICRGGTDMRDYIGLGLPTPAQCSLMLQLVAS